MARFVVDIANVDLDAIPTVMEMIKDMAANDEKTQGIVTVYCIDETNQNQFYSVHENGLTNNFSDKQLAKFKEVCDE